jgi:hypothetical protein
MIALFVTITLCRGHENSTSLKHVKKSLKPSIITDDLLTCYSAYADLVKVLSGGKKQGTNNFKSSPADELAAFEGACLGTVEVGKCSTFLGTVSSGITAGDLTDLKANCGVDEPTPNSAKCYDAYTALISELDKLTRQKQKIPVLKASPGDEYIEYLKECTATTQTAECSAVIVDIVPATGPVVGEVSDIKKYCAVAAPEPPKEDKGTYTAKASTLLLLAIGALAKIYWAK